MVAWDDPAYLIDLVARVQARDEQAAAELYRALQKAFGHYFVKHLGMNHVEDKLHDLFLIVYDAIHKCTLRDPARVLGFAFTAARRLCNAQIGENMGTRAQFDDLEIGG